ncbi:MAG: DNA-protecting protein DprA [Clostridiales bacterium]|nr:DNA-protecting protein DprA [Clostridiales bacterium]
MDDFALDFDDLCRIWLACSESLTHRMRDRLFARYGSASAIFENLSPDAAPLISTAAYGELVDLKHAGLDKIMLRLKALQISLALRNKPEYPPLLDCIPDPPDVLFYRGHMPLISGKSVAIVGSRRETRYGREQAYQIAAELAQNGIVIISGLARGIDTAAHKGALSVGGRTIAVLGSGLERMYPPENEPLSQEMIRLGGAIMTELPPHTEPQAFRFPIRNRIISGMADALLLVEAREKSGTMITVGHALVQGREVFALPGQVDAPGSVMPHRFIREGARLCTCAGDLMDDMGWQTIQAEHRNEQLRFTVADLTDTQKKIYDALCDEVRSMEELVAVTDLDISDLSTQLTMLEIDGLIEKLPGNLYRLMPGSKA